MDRNLPYRFLRGQPLNFSDCHRGKGECHRKEVTVKAHMTVYLIEGEDFENAGQMIDTSRLSGGIPGLSSPSVSW